MNQIKSKKTLINWELVSVNPNDKTWDWKDLFCFWGNNIQSVIAFSLIASLYLVYELNLFVVLFGSPGSPETNKFSVVLSASAWLAMFTYVSNVLND